MISRFDAHHRLLIAIAIAAVVFLMVRDQLSAPARIVVGWDVYAASTLLLAWISILYSSPQEIRRVTSPQDSSRAIITSLLLLAAVASIFSVVVLLRQPAQFAPVSTEPLSLRVALSFTAVVCSWSLVHTTFALRYAHIFYDTPASGKGAAHEEGLSFPGTDEPDFLDFAYFAFVIGMTSQVSDVAITSRRMRRQALLHGVISFGFNTMVLALGVNVMSGLI
jgi:uncharacterized membrane protein